MLLLKFPELSETAIKLLPIVSKSQERVEAVIGKPEGIEVYV